MGFMENKVSTDRGWGGDVFGMIQAHHVYYAAAALQEVEFRRSCERGEWLETQLKLGSLARLSPPAVQPSS